MKNEKTFHMQCQTCVRAYWLSRATQSTIGYGTPSHFTKRIIVLLREKAEVIVDTVETKHAKKSSKFDDRNHELGFVSKKCDELDTHQKSESEKLIH